MTGRVHEEVKWDKTDQSDEMILKVDFKDDVILVHDL